MNITSRWSTPTLVILTLLASSAAADIVERTVPANQIDAKRLERQIVDVALQTDNIVRGRVVEESGAPLDGAQVVLSQADRVVATAITDSRGEFAVTGLGSGVYRIETPTSAGTYRFWRTEDAPPSAKPVALIVSQEPTLRAQYGRNTGMMTLGVGAAGLTAGVLSYQKADDAENLAARNQSEIRKLKSP